jgi:GTP-binding protein
MWFVDRAQVTFKAGDGGRGCASFAHPPYTRTPFPDGGDGGDGGDVIVAVDANLATLLDFHFRHEFTAGRGGHGGSNTKTGRRGTERLVRVPPGTVVMDAASGAVVADLTEAGQRVVVAHGGRGGYGNALRSASARTLRGEWRPQAAEATPGGPGERREVILELKLLADVGLIGFPNAGKSSLLSCLSTARPKVGAYPFTTRYPVLGVVGAGEDRSFVACDIPGLIEGAHEGRGLGIQFLRHIERTRLLLHLLDLAAVDGRDPLAAYHRLNEELAAYSPGLLRRPQMVVGNKMDLPEARPQAARVAEALGLAPADAAGVPAVRRLWPISCATGEGMPALRLGIRQALDAIGWEGTRAHAH